MKTIYKYKLHPGRTQVEIPARHHVLHAGLDGEGEVCVWAMVDTGKPAEAVVFRVVGTGHEIPGDASLDHVGSVTQGPFVWHVFREMGETEAVMKALNL